MPGMIGVGGGGGGTVGPRIVSGGSPRPPVPPPAPLVPRQPTPQELHYQQIQQQQAPAPAMAPPPQIQAPQIQVPQIQVPQMATHAAQTDPRLTEYLDRVRTRLDNPGNDQRALNQAGQAINQFAQGQRNTAVGNAARRGVLGVAGAESQIQDDIGNIAQGNFAKAAESIAIQRMRDNDAVLMGAQQAFAEPGRQGLADRGLGIQAAGQQGQLAMQAAGLNLNAQLANQQAAQQVGQMNYQAQLQQAAMAQQQQLAVMQMYANLYR